MPITLYGIRNCDTMRKARRWLDDHALSYTLHDYRKDGIEQPLLERWCQQADWEKFLNRAGTTFRKLPESEKTDIDERKAIELMLAQPSMIKRPVLEFDSKLVIGFDAETFEQVFRSARS